VIGALRTEQDDRWYGLALGGLIVGAWGALLLWGASPYADLLGHEGAAPGALAVRLPLFALGWLLMTVAMMLPGSLPLINLFRRVVVARPERNGLVARLLLGYLAVWLLFGVVADLADVGLHALVAWSAPGPVAVEAIASAVALAAGVYQFTPLKHLCLERCRSPLSFLVQHWRGRDGAGDALRLGVRHGLFCLGCCWTLMLLMFALASANLAWMLVLGALMAAERTSSWGRLLTRPTGFALIAWAAIHLGGRIVALA
jgi:predicted metal-binding membrane protein